MSYVTLIYFKYNKFFYIFTKSIVNRDYGTPYLANPMPRAPSTSSMKTPSLLPTTKDILVCYSTLDGMN
jgi:hypothetical protein